MDRHQTVFVHIPKCGGTSILKALSGRTRPRDHFNFQVYQQADSGRFTRYFKFAFVREPLSRIQSIYTYLQRGGNGTSDAPLCREINDQCRNLGEFVEHWLQERHLQTIPFLRPQAYFLYDGYSQRLAVDFVGRHEHFERDCKFVFERLGISSEVPLENASVHSAESANAETYITSGATQRIHELYAFDYEILNYD